MNSLLRRGLLSRGAAIAKRRWFSLTSKRLSEMNDPLEHATGIEKRELLAIKAGCKDPFMVGTVLKRGEGSKESPTMIPSAFDGRLVGCACRGQRFACWMWLEKDCPKRCECGHWFAIQPVEPL